MFCHNTFPSNAYQELEPLCEKGHVVLVQNSLDGELYVKKRVVTYEPGLYLSLLEHPAKNTPRLYGIYEDPQTAPATSGAVSLILIEEYIPGHTLSEVLREGRLLSTDECIDIGIQLCSVLMELHCRKPAIIHRDIKPSNVMLLPDGSVRLIDFSASKTASGLKKRDTVLIGTAGFAAPEQYGFSASTPQTDIYALGVLLNVMLTGALPCEKKAAGKLGSIISRCLKMEPRSRYAGTWELYAALRRVKKQQIPWLFPGFRTLRWYKMVPAFIWYSFVILFAFRANVESIDIASQVCVRLILIMLGLFPVLFYGNYMNIQRSFPFMRSQRRAARILGLVIAPLFMVLLMIVICVIVSLLLIW